MVATVRCEEIANEKYGSFSANEVYVFQILCLQCYFFLLDLANIPDIDSDKIGLKFLTGVVSNGRGCSIWSSFWLRKEA